jgi:hypothetical protein
MPLVSALFGFNTKACGQSSKKKKKNLATIGGRLCAGCSLPDTKSQLPLFGQLSALSQLANRPVDPITWYHRSTHAHMYCSFPCCLHICVYMYRYIYIYMHTHIYICIVRHKSSLTGGSCIKIRPGCLFTASLQCMELLLKGGTNNEYASASFFFCSSC